MIVSQLATCEACRDGSCDKCKTFKRRQRMSKMFEVKTRDKNGESESYVTLADGAPEWLSNAIYEAHDGALPCDWIYAECRDAFESEDTDVDEYADSAVEVYTGRLFAWAAEFCGTSIFSAAEEQASEIGEGGSINDQLMRIQYCAIRRIANTIWEARDEHENDVDEEEEKAS